MSAPVKLPIAEGYAAELDDFLANATELGLNRAYEVGREALEHDLGVLELAAMHREALDGWLRRVKNGDEAAGLSWMADAFFLEALAPMEMALQGFREANEGLRVLNDRLEVEVEERAGQVRQAFDEFRRADRARRQLLRRLNDAEEQERKLLASALHDDTIQMTTAAMMRVGALGAATTDPDVRRELEVVEVLLSDSIGRCRRLIFALRPVTLDVGGLVAAVEEMLQRVPSDGLAYTIEHDLSEEPNGDAAIVAFRVLDEAVRNVQKHAGATRVLVTIGRRGDALEVSCTDDGCGFDVAAASPQPGHLGLRSMRERVELAGGTWTATSALGEGTTIQAVIPLD